jgi:hypothetical protein
MLRLITRAFARPTYTYRADTGLKLQPDNMKIDEEELVANYFKEVKKIRDEKLVKEILHNRTKGQGWVTAEMKRLSRRAVRALRVPGDYFDDLRLHPQMHQVEAYIH